jgi:hypothetical protein
MQMKKDGKLVLRAWRAHHRLNKKCARLRGEIFGRVVAEAFVNWCEAVDVIKTEKEDACLTLQRSGRGYIGRKAAVRRRGDHWAARKIQAAWRAKLARREAMQLRKRRDVLEGQIGLLQVLTPPKKNASMSPSSFS